MAEPIEWLTHPTPVPRPTDETVKHPARKKLRRIEALRLRADLSDTDLLEEIGRILDERP